MSPLTRQCNCITFKIEFNTKSGFSRQLIQAFSQFQLTFAMRQGLKSLADLAFDRIPAPDSNPGLIAKVLLRGLNTKSGYLLLLFLEETLKGQRLIRC